MNRSLLRRWLSQVPKGRPIGSAFVLLLVALAVPAVGQSAYGFIRTVDGQADLLNGDAQPAIEVTANYPIQVGDRLIVAPDGRLEIVLPDSNLLRLDGNTELRFSRLARSLDSQDDQNLLTLLQGQAHIEVSPDPVDPRGFRIDTANATLFLSTRGSYRIFTDGKTWTQMIVRHGYAEVVTEEESRTIATGQQALIDGDRAPSVTVQAAPAMDDLERWAQQLNQQANTVEAQVGYRRGAVPASLRYAAAPLQRYGRWTTYRGSQVWRPQVSHGWRPYHSGWWIYTPAGLTWVSTEPWGWVPYHYGSWGFAGSIGWVWYPGDSWTPGHVYWYWGPTYVGWRPIGPYPPHFRYPFYSLPPFGNFWGYGGWRWGHRPGGWPRPEPYGFHGRVGGKAAHWRDWTFSPYDSFGYRDNHRYLTTGAELERQGALKGEIPRGIVTTRTRDLTPNLWQDPGRAMAALENPRTSRSRSSDLSPLGSAALSGYPSTPPRADRGSRLGERQRATDSRQWDPQTWRQQQFSRPQAQSRYRRDARSSFSRPQSYGARSSDIYSRHMSRGRSLSPSGRSAIGGQRSGPGTTRSLRSAPPTPGSSLRGGRSSSPGRSAAPRGRPGSNRGGTPRGGAMSSTSGGGGSG